jgi:RNA polymerase sigma-70 factor (ECF subfamily)
MLENEIDSKQFSKNALLISELKTGNEKAYTHLVDQYHEPLCAYAHSLINDRDIAQDIVQNVFVKIYEKRKSLKEDFIIERFLYKSVFNEFIDQYRKNKLVTKLEKKHIEALHEYFESEDGKLEALFTMVQTEIDNLPPKCKRIFVLSKKEGLSNKEISNHLSISIKTVEAHITKAFFLIRERIDLSSRQEIILTLLFKGYSYS